jgi:hypothetical protein
MAAARQKEMNDSITVVATTTLTVLPLRPLSRKVISRSIAGLTGDRQVLFGTHILA